MLFELLARLDSEKSVSFADPAEHRVLSKLEGQLEEVLTEPLAPNYKALVSEARRVVRESPVGS